MTLRVGLTVCLSIPLMLSGCRAQFESSVAETPAIKQAKYYDFQTRYLIAPGRKGFDLTVFINARGRSFGHAAMRMVQESTLAVAERYADQQDRAIQPVDPAEIQMGLEQYDVSGEQYWVGKTPVWWARERD